MTRGPKKHMKRLNAPSHWMLDKLGGIFVSSLLPALSLICSATIFMLSKLTTDGGSGPQSFRSLAK